MIVSKRHQPPGLEILHEDRDILVVNKAPGVLTIATDRRESNTVHAQLMHYVSKGNPKSKDRIYIVHRLDREVSGVLVFAKTIQAKEYLQDHWDETEKKYLAVVHGKPKVPSGTITTYLAENKARYTYSTTDRSLGKLSRTGYQVLQESKEYSLLLVHLLTGRKNQIRVHLADIGHPIVGDKKYGFEDDPHKRIALHAFSLAITHPYSGEPLLFETKMPEFFRKLLV